jgi:hypothetical protein
VLLKGVVRYSTRAVEREVATVEIFMIRRPSPPPVHCAPLSVTAPAYVPARVRAELPQVHRVQNQSELVRDLVPVVGSDGTDGFRGSKGVGSAAKAVKWITDARGVPPRGRPV